MRPYATLERAPMTNGMRDYLMEQGQQGRAMLGAASTAGLRVAWAHRHDSGRARVVVRANVRMLRNLRAF